jgi:hypothetical protein
MNEQIIYDKAKYHIEGDFPDGLNKSQAHVPTGFFVAWLAMKPLVSEEILFDFKNEVDSLKTKTVSPSSLYRAVGGVLSEDMLTAEGNAFTQQYFDFDHGQYLDDYDELLSEHLPSFFHVADTWKNYDVLAKRIDERFAVWKKNLRKH